MSISTCCGILSRAGSVMEAWPTRDEDDGIPASRPHVGCGDRMSRKSKITEVACRPWWEVIESVRVRGRLRRRIKSDC